MYFQNYGLHNMTVNKLNGSKQYQNLHDINLFIIFNHSDRDWVRKCLLVIDRDWVRKCLLVIRETLGLFVNILTADD